MRRIRLAGQLAEPISHYADGVEAGGFLYVSGIWQTYNKALLASGSQVPKPSQWSSDPYSMTYYDAVNIMALAMLAAKSTSPAVFNKDVMTVTNPGPGKTVVTSFAAGKAALAAGKQVQYVGAGGPSCSTSRTTRPERSRPRNT